MDAYNDPGIREIIFVKPTQVGGTTTAENILGYIIDQFPAPTMWVCPDDLLAKTTSQNRIQPMVSDCDVLAEKFNRRGSKVKELRFVGTTIYFATAGSASQLAMKSIKNLFLDEIDKITGEIKNEGDAVELAEERVKTFPNHKIFKTSTPTTKYGRIWSAMQSADIIKKPKVRCPHCGEYIELLFKHLKWEKTEKGNDVSAVWYVCQECGGCIEERHRPAMLRTVRWFVVTRNRNRTERVAFWMNTLYSPFVRWEKVAMKWLGAQGDPGKLQNFVNSWLAEPWVDSHSEIDIQTILNSQTDTPRSIVPSWAEMITGGVDVQEKSLYWSIKAWGPHLTGQTIDHGQVLNFSDVETVMNLEYRKADGTPYIVGLCAVDSGDRTDEVYEFCKLNAEWAVAVKGASKSLLGYYRVSSVDRPDSSTHGMTLINVDTGKYKDMIASRYDRENGQGAFMVYKDCEEEYAAQLTAEQKVTDTKSGKSSWVKKGGRENHYLDTEVYNGVAADIMGVRSLHLQTEQPPSPPPPKQNQYSDWLKG